MNFAAFHFLRPYALLALLPIGLLLVLLARSQRRRNPWHGVCDPQLLPHVLSGDSGGRSRWAWAAATLGALLSVVALAGPTWQRLPQPTYLDQSGLVIVLDLNSSMNAADLKPSRLLRARYKIADILRSRHQGQTGLVVYSGDAFTVTPMTDDTNTIYSQLSVLDPSLMPSRGNRAGLGVTRAASLLHNAGLAHGDVLLVADSVDEARLKPAVEKLRDEGYRLSILGVGTDRGAPVPLTGGGFQLDSHGAIVLSQLQGRTLRKMAELGGGIYRRIAPTDADIHALQAEFAQHWRSQASKKTSVVVDTWREEGPWLLLPVLILAAFAFRRGLVFGLLLFVFCAPQQARAMDWHSLWANRNQRGSEALQRGKPEEAARLFTNRRWKAAADYRGGDYANALKALKGLRGKDDWYNRGNALARLGRYRQAIGAYRQALKQAPGFKDARFNERLLEKLLNKQQKHNKQGKTGGKKSRSGHASSGDRSAASGGKNGKGQKSGSSAKNPANGRQHEKSASGGSKGKSPGKAASSAGARARKSAGRKPGENHPQGAHRLSRSHAGKNGTGRSSAAVGRRNRLPGSENAATAGTMSKREKAQADSQWLRQVPDDPGGLLRRKFYYEYHQRHPDSD